MRYKSTVAGFGGGAFFAGMLETLIMRYFSRKRSPVFPSDFSLSIRRWTIARPSNSQYFNKNVRRGRSPIQKGAEIFQSPFCRFVSLFCSVKFQTYQSRLYSLCKINAASPRVIGSLGRKSISARRTIKFSRAASERSAMLQSAKLPLSLNCAKCSCGFTGLR